MKRNTKIALVLCLAVLGTAIEARADCQERPWQHHRDRHCLTKRSFGRLLGNCDWRAERRQHGGRHRPTAQCDVIRYLRDEPGRYVDCHWSFTRTPIPGEPPGEFTVHVDPTITGGSGKYARSYRHDDVRWTDAQRLWLVSVWEPSIWFIEVASAVRILKPTETEPVVDRVH